MTSSLPLIGIIGVSNLLAAYAAYLALSVWRGLVTPAYRSRALWTGAFAILTGAGLAVSGNVNSIFPPDYQLAARAAAYLFLYPAAILVIFVFIGRTLNAIIRLDYLRRDVLGWKRFRTLFWGVVGVQFIVYFAFFFFMSALSSNAILGVLYVLVLLVPLSYGAACLVVGSRRTKDTTFRSHAKWFGYCIGGIVLAGVVVQFTTIEVLDALPDILIGYSLYRMARFLVPAERLPTAVG